MTDKTAQTVRHRRLSAELKRMREASGVPIEDAAHVLGANRTKVQRIERGEWKRLKETDIRKLSTLYGVTDPSQQDALVALAKQAKEKGWWTRYSDVLGPGTYVSLEAVASSFRFYGGLMIPGLLQTPAYAKAITRGSGVEDETEVKRRVEARLKRQKILDDPNPPVVEAIIDEAALRKSVGGGIAMREQLLHLMLLNEQGTAQIRVVSDSSGAHRAMTGQFVIINFPPDEQDPVIFIDISREGLFMEEPDDIARYTAMYDSLDKISLPLRESNKYIATLIDRLAG